MVFQSTMKPLHKLTSPPTLQLSAAICVYLPDQLVSQVAAMASWQACNRRATPTHCFGIPRFHGKFHQNPMQSAGPVLISNAKRIWWLQRWFPCTFLGTSSLVTN
ncbi:hypothetical protein NC653_004315 [Populus alba x Populus x berolinensis]|uniref:Uncharacterized protein n=1 Tax=Populus alba x Populus x berolinensis TaxID=444605 RepID=A0AAD6RVZ3_9ROSI|nr:hypothetical protein NC653_004315 [Populus alba x Populus x berolinensis]